MIEVKDRGRLIQTKYYDVACSECGEYEQPGANDYRGSERLLREWGWRKRGGLWVCPECIEVANERP